MKTKFETISMDKELVEGIKDLAKDFYKNFASIQSSIAINNIGKEHHKLIINDVNYCENLLLISAATTIVFSFHFNCVIEDTPFDTKSGNVNHREYELLNLWIYVVSEFTGVDSKSISKLVNMMLADFNDCYLKLKNKEFGIENYLNKGFCTHYNSPEFGACARHYIKEHCSFNFVKVNEMTAQVTNSFYEDLVV